MVSTIPTGLVSREGSLSTMFIPAVAQDSVTHRHPMRISVGALRELTWKTGISTMERVWFGYSSTRIGDGCACLCMAARALGMKEGQVLYDGALLDRLLQERTQREEERKRMTLADQLRLGGLDGESLSYKENFVIRCYEVGMNRTASIETIANLLQEVACNHAQSVGFSTDGFATTPSMRKRRLIWVTTRMHIELDEYPVWGDVVVVETWCQSEGKVGTRRDWLVTNVATGKMLGRATSTWVMMNQDTRRLARITDDIRADYIILCPDPPRWAFPEENNCSLKKIPKLEDPAQHMQSGLMPRRVDLDMNQHVNNVTYIGWILESMPQNIIETHQLYRITLDYRRECKRDDIVESLTGLEYLHQTKFSEKCSYISNCGNGAAVNGTALIHSPNIARDNLQFLHMLRLAGSDLEINRGRTEWRRKVERPHNILQFPDAEL